MQFRNASAWSVLAALNLSGKGTACENLKRDKICPSFIEAKKWQLLWSLSNLVSWICWYRTEEDVASAPISNRQVMGKQQEDGIPRKGLSLKSLPELDNRHKNRGCITTFTSREIDLEGRMKTKVGEIIRARKIVSRNTSYWRIKWCRELKVIYILMVKANSQIVFFLRRGIFDKK